MKRVVPFLLGLAVAAWGAEEGEPARVEVGVYSEFLGYDEVAPELGALTAAHADLNLAVSSDRIGDASLASLLRDAESGGVAVRLWLVVSMDDGYWPNEANLGLFAAEVERLLDWLEADELAADAIVYDMEPSLEYTRQLVEIGPMDLAALVEMLRTHQDPGAFEASRALLVDNVRAVQARGLRAVCVTYPQVVDDLLDGDDDIQDALDIPIRDVPFDEVAFMVYQTVIAEVAGGWIGPGLVSAYAADARAHFGDRAAIALGIVGPVGIEPPPAELLYADPSILESDIAAAIAEGIGRVELYSLDGMLLEGGPDRWLSATQPGPIAARASPQSDLIRSLAAGLDAELDR